MRPGDAADGGGARLSQLLDNPEQFLQSHSFPADTNNDNDVDKAVNNRLRHSQRANGDTTGDDGAMPGFCVECEDQPASLFCRQCADDYCDVCFQALHRKGSRRAHLVGPLKAVVDADTSMGEASASVVAAADGAGQVDQDGNDTNDTNDDADDDEDTVTAETMLQRLEAVAEQQLQQQQEQSTGGRSKQDADIVERAKWIPVRLDAKERRALRLLEAALSVSEYTDRIDVVGGGSSRPGRIVTQIKDLCAILCGLVVASDYSTGQQLVADKDYKYNADFFRRVFEVGRRHKIMNPEKMRATYGKLVYLLMDAQAPHIREMLEFDCVNSVKTVTVWLQSMDAVAGDRLLRDPLVQVATREIMAPPGRPRHEIQRDIKQKERAIEVLAKRHATSTLSQDAIRTCLYSIGDNSSFLRGNRDPIDRMIALLKQHFNPQATEPPFALSISIGSGGARLAHSHERQFYYVLQSLTLWSEINHHMFKLWCLAEQDMLDGENMYRLRDTGQGLNRIQGCPRVSREIHRILAEVMRRVGNWVGSSVVHLGDTNVPNALVFIDKYTQIARILNPIVLCIDRIDSDLMRNAALAAHINTTYGGPLKLQKEILCDFFKHAFDGSGADNFFDAGSCIDGRLTSAWNWCHSVEKKRYFPIFLLCGFVGFDGQDF